MSGHPGINCTACRTTPPAFDQLFAVWSYAPPLDSVIHELKFGRLAYLGEHLGELIAWHLASTLPPVDLIVPIPLHWTRLVSRGYNQAEEIARSAGRHLQLPIRRLLHRQRRTRAQTSLSRRRRQSNLLDAFRARRSSAIEGRRIALFDDVSTTGATLSSGAAALRAAGATTVIAVAAARTTRRAPIGGAGKDLEVTD